ncbi:hypothetical protein JXQ70_09280 [bacterium]|nr:hypothetical protein [bacterium]
MTIILRNEPLKRVLLILLGLLLCSCASKRALKSELILAQSNLAATQEKMAELELQIQEKEQENQQLRAEKQDLEDARMSLGKEKTVRVDQAREIRRTARHFIRSQTSALKLFAENPALLDYLGSEPIERTRFDESKSVLIVDVAHPLPAEAILFSGQVFLHRPRPFFFCLIRSRMKDYHVVWMSQEHNLNQSGAATVSFDAGISCQQGDLLGIYFPEGVGLPHDELGGSTALIKGPISAGQPLPAKALAKPTTRNYSFGVLGFLD